MTEGGTLRIQSHPSHCEFMSPQRSFCELHLKALCLSHPVFEDKKN